MRGFQIKIGVRLRYSAVNRDYFIRITIVYPSIGSTAALQSRRTRNERPELADTSVFLQRGEYVVHRHPRFVGECVGEAHLHEVID
jgi:hypothetical protein